MSEQMQGGEYPEESVDFGVFADREYGEELEADIVAQEEYLQYFDLAQDQRKDQRSFAALASFYTEVREEAEAEDSTVNQSPALQTLSSKTQPGRPALRPRALMQFRDMVAGEITVDEEAEANALVATGLANALFEAHDTRDGKQAEAASDALIALFTDEAYWPSRGDRQYVGEQELLAKWQAIERAFGEVYDPFQTKVHIRNRAVARIINADPAAMLTDRNDSGMWTPGDELYRLQNPVMEHLIGRDLLMMTDEFFTNYIKPKVVSDVGREAWDISARQYLTAYSTLREHMRVTVPSAEDASEHQVYLRPIEALNAVLPDMLKQKRKEIFARGKGALDGPVINLYTRVPSFSLEGEDRADSYSRAMSTVLREALTVHLAVKNPEQYQFAVNRLFRIYAMSELLFTRSPQIGSGTEQVIVDYINAFSGCGGSEMRAEMQELNEDRKFKYAGRRREEIVDAMFAEFMNGVRLPEDISPADARGMLTEMVAHDIETELFEQGLAFRDGLDQARYDKAKADEAAANAAPKRKGIFAKLVGR